MKKLLYIGVLAGVLSCSSGEKTSEQTTKEIPQYTIEQFLSNQRVAGGDFSDNNSKLLISSDSSGIFNAYEIDIATGKMTQKTFSKTESVIAQSYVPNADSLFIYSADKGGNEISHLFLAINDSTAKDLTPGEKEKAHFGKWSRDKKSFYYVSNKRDERFFDFYKMPVSTWEPELLYKNENGMDIDQISYDEKYFTLTLPLTTSSNKLFLVNREDNSQVEISDTVAQYYGAGFSKDNKNYYYITNAGKEFAYLVEYSIEAKTKKTIFETNWDVMYSFTTEHETYRVIAINEDGCNKLIIKELASGNTVDFPAIEDGDIKSIHFTDNEKMARLTIGSSVSPDNIYVYNFETKELKKLTETLNPEIERENLAKAEIVRYKSFDGLEIPALYYKPLSANADNKVPALIWVHGGPGGQSRVGYSGLIQYLVNHGYAILAVNNRGSSGYGKSFYTMDDLNHGDKDLKDCIWGKKWLQTHSDIDSSKIGILGGSYGGYMTMAALAFTPEEFSVGVNIFGVTNWVRTLKSIPSYWESYRDALYKELGDPFSADSVRLYNISPLFHAENITKPVMVLQGVNDPRVLKIESDEIVEAVKKNNVPVEYVVFEDEGHGFMKKETQIKGYSKILSFLDTYLK